MEQKLNDYVSGETHYIPIMNIMLNNRSEDWYAELGKYITETLDIEKIPYLSFFVDKVEEREGMVAISFITGVLDEDVLEKMFGKPIFHNHFGEGFEGEYDEETDEYGEPEIKESYASYFVNVGGINLHIGYDHRGTDIEVETGEFDVDNVFSDEKAKKCFESLKNLVDVYKSEVSV